MLLKPKHNTLISVMKLVQASTTQFLCKMLLATTSSLKVVSTKLKWVGGEDVSTTCSPVNATKLESKLTNFGLTSTMIKSMLNLTLGNLDEIDEQTVIFNKILKLFFYYNQIFYLQKLYFI